MVLENFITKMEGGMKATGKMERWRVWESCTINLIGWPMMENGRATNFQAEEPSTMSFHSLSLVRSIIEISMTCRSSG
jgi:hypothetical protein